MGREQNWYWQLWIKLLMWRDLFIRQFIPASAFFNNCSYDKSSQNTTILLFRTTCFDLKGHRQVENNLLRTRGTRVCSWKFILRSCRLCIPFGSRTYLHFVCGSLIFFVCPLLSLGKNVSKRHVLSIFFSIPLRARTGPEGSRKLKLPDFKTKDTWRWYGCQL